jgi:NADPH:quinone reductase-like Zn-dependent oxidoreductase
MTRRRKILASIALLLAVAVGVLAYVLSHESACIPAPTLAADAPRMKAIVHRCYGGPELLKLEEIEKPAPADNEVLVKVHAAAVNPLDWHYMRGKPYIMRMSSGFGAPSSPRLGVDFAGIVESVGSRVTRFKPGDAVFGSKRGAFAEYVRVPEDQSLVLKPANVSFEQAASAPIAAITALQALRDQGRLQPGQKVLINGASGGVGTFAVQIAKALGAEVTGVCSTRNVELVKSLGADHVVDYTQEDFAQGGKVYDLVLDNVGNRPMSDYTDILKPDGIFVIIGGPNEGAWLGAMISPIKAKLLSPFVSQDFRFFLADSNPADLTLLGELMQSGKVAPVIDRHYPLAEVPAAIAYLESGRARGKVIIDMP